MKKITIKTVIDCILILLLTVLSFKKGGFYKTDALFFHVFVLGIGSIYLIYQMITEKQWKQGKTLDPIAILLLLLPLAYCLPIIFQTSASMTDSIEEVLRYFDVYLIYHIVKQSQCKQKYLYAMVGITLLQFIIGIDGIANRYLQGILHHLNSGFLSSINVTRMSGTIQYANIFAILCTISFFIVHHITMKKEGKTKLKQAALFATKHTLSTIFLMGILLSGSRMVCFITAVAMIYDILITPRGDRKTKILTFIILLVMAGIGTVSISSFIMISPGKIYAACLLYIVTIWVLGFLCNRSIPKLMSWNLKQHKYVSLVAGISFLMITVIAMIIVIGARAPIELTEQSLERTVTRNFYPVQKGIENILEIHTKSLQEDTRYEIQVIAVKEEDKTELLDTFHYYDNTTGNYILQKEVSPDTKYWMVRIYLEQGQLQVTKLLLNGSENGLNYAYLPSDLWYRFQDNTTKNTGTYQRLSYYKDALTLVTESPKTLLFGIGGGGFEAKYETVKSSAYTSTEVHSGLLQILVEAGMIGFIIFTALICFAIFHAKRGMPRMILCLLLLHSWVDLEFSYTIMLMVLAVLLALQEGKAVSNAQKEKSSLFAFGCAIVGIILGMTLCVIATRQWIAYEMKVPKETQTQETLESTIEMVTAHETRVALDPFNPNYRETLHTAYEKYASQLKSYIETQGKDSTIFQTEYQNILTNMVINANALQRQNPYQTHILLTVSEIWINHLLELATLYDASDVEKGIEHYLAKVVENITQIYALPNQEQATKNANIFAKEANLALKNVNAVKNSPTIEKYIQILENTLT